MVEEIWKLIPLSEPYNNLYMTSNLGRIKKLKHVNGSNHKVEERILKSRTDRYNYQIISLKHLGKVKTFKVHRLVALAFLEIENPDKLVVNHKDGNKQNNNIDNLEWTTQSYNAYHSHNIINKYDKEKEIKHCKEMRIKSKQVKAKKVKMINAETNETIRIFEALSDAMEFLTGDGRKCSTQITLCCRGKRKTFKGYKWEYLE